MAGRTDLLHWVTSHMEGKAGLQWIIVSRADFKARPCLESCHVSFAYFFPNDANVNGANSSKGSGGCSWLYCSSSSFCLITNKIIASIHYLGLYLR